MWKRIKIRLWAWLTPSINLIRNLFLPNAFRIGYITEMKLAIAEKRIKEYQEFNTRLLKEQHLSKIRMFLLEGSIKAVIAMHPRGCVYIPKEDVRDAAKRWRQIDTKEKDGRIRFQVRENKEWRKEHAGESIDDAGGDRGAGPTAADILGT